MSDPTCRGFRELLGIYVVGAIEPAERSLVDAHLSYCHECREELAGLAVLPALLHRVAVNDAEHLLGTDASGDDSPEPSPGLLSAALRQVASRRRARRLRTALALAALSLGVASATAMATSALVSHSARPVAKDRARIRVGLVDAMVKYGKPQWGGPGTEMEVRVRGLPIGTKCTFWVVPKDRRPEWAGGWTVGPNASKLWYPADLGIAKNRITEFVLRTNSGEVLMIPAT